MNITILQHPDDRLRQRSDEVSEKATHTPEFKELIEHMATAMHRDDGIGIAAPQIGVLQRVIIINTSGHDEICVNPEILSSSWKTDIDIEGCLSVPGVFGTVRRPHSVKVRYKDINGVLREENPKGHRARVFQHEIDHLNGILFIDKVEKITQGRIKEDNKEDNAL